MATCEDILTKHGYSYSIDCISPDALGKPVQTPLAWIRKIKTFLKNEFHIIVSLVWTAVAGIEMQRSRRHNLILLCLQILTEKLLRSRPYSTKSSLRCTYISSWQSQIHLSFQLFFSSILKYLLFTIQLITDIFSNWNAKQDTKVKWVSNVSHWLFVVVWVQFNLHLNQNHVRSHTLVKSLMWK